MTLEQQIKSEIRDIPDFPKPGILFKDITPLLQDAETFRQVTDFFVRRYAKEKVNAVVAVESRGFIFGAPLAYELGAAFVPVRKQGKLPYKSVQHSYDLEYSSATIEMHVDAVQKGDRVLVIDDLLATGGTASAACTLLEKQGAKVLECAFIVELAFLKGRDALQGRKIISLVQY